MIQRYTKELKRSYENVTRWNISKFITRIYLTEAWKCISLFLTHQLPWDRSHSFQIQLLKLRYRETEKERAIHYLDATEQSSIQFTHNALFSNGFCVCVSIRWCTWMKNKKKIHFEKETHAVYDSRLLHIRFNRRTLFHNTDLKKADDLQFEECWIAYSVVKS